MIKSYEYTKRWRLAHPDKVKVFKKHYQEKHIDHLRNKNSQYYFGHLTDAKIRNRRNWLMRGYGLTLDDYDKLLKLQHGVCAICGRPPTKNNLAVDHQHVRGYKKLPPEEKKKFVRGLLCFRCNKILVGKHTSRTAFRVYEYLKRSEK